MSKEKLLLSSGIWIAVLPYLGFPYFLKNILFSISGLLIAYLSYVLYVSKQNDEGGENFDNFSENNDWKVE